MFSDFAMNGPDCWKCTLNVEWHDCSWCPSITLRRGIEIRRGAVAKPLPAAAILPHPARRKNLAKPMKKIGNRPTSIRNPQSAIRNSLAFTLTELLVVIAIIGILAAMIMPALAAAKKHALMMKAKTEISAIVTAIEAYDQDYSRYPITSGPSPSEQWAAGGNDFTTGMIFGLGRNGNGTGLTYDNNNNVIAILMDLTTYPNGAQTCNTNHMKNPKQVKYLNAKMSGYDPTTNDPNPPGGVDNSGVYRDPWGNPYVITMNTSYSEQGTSDNLYSLQSVSQNPPGAYVQTGYNGLFNPNTSPANQAQKDSFLYHGKVMAWSAGPDKQYDTGPANTGVNKDNVISW